MSGLVSSKCEFHAFFINLPYLESVSRLCLTEFEWTYSNGVEKIIKIAPPLKLFGAKSEPLTIKTRNLPQSSMMYHFVQESHFTSSLVQIVPHAMQKNVLQCHGVQDQFPSFGRRTATKMHFSVIGTNNNKTLFRIFI